MARGGFREGAGRKPDPNSKRQRALAKKGAVEPAADRTLTLPNGQKSPDAPADWPFGTKPQEPVEPEPKHLTAREFLSQLVNDLGANDKVRLDAAKRLIEFEEPRPLPMGKKEQRAEAAKKVAAGGSRFSASRAPLALVKR